MSELTPCNYCTLKGIRARAIENDNHVYLHRKTWELGGIDIYVAPEGVALPQSGVGEGSEFHKQYWVCWFMKIPESCCC